VKMRSGDLSTLLGVRELPRYFRTWGKGSGAEEAEDEEDSRRYPGD
jgi:hypothetical protein